MATSVEKKTVKTTFLDDFRSSFPEVLYKIFEKIANKAFLVECFVSNIKKNIIPRMFSRKFYLNFQNNWLAAFLICWLNNFWLNNCTYFFFGHLCVFSEYFSLRSNLRLNCVEKPLRWRLQTSLFFCLHWKKNISLFSGELLLRKL